MKNFLKEIKDFLNETVTFGPEIKGKKNYASIKLTIKMWHAYLALLLLFLVLIFVLTLFVVK